MPYRHFREVHELYRIEQYDTNSFLKDCNLTCHNLFGINEINQGKGYNLFEDPNLDAAQKNEIKVGKNVRYEIEYNFDIVKKSNY